MTQYFLFVMLLLSTFPVVSDRSDDAPMRLLVRKVSIDEGKIYFDLVNVKKNQIYVHKNIGAENSVVNQISLTVLNLQTNKYISFPTLAVDGDQASDSKEEDFVPLCSECSIGRVYFQGALQSLAPGRYKLWLVFESRWFADDSSRWRIKPWRGAASSESLVIKKESRSG